MISTQKEYWQSIILDGEDWSFAVLEMAAEILAPNTIGNALMGAFPIELADREKESVHYLVEKRKWSWRAYLMATIRKATTQFDKLQEIVPEFVEEVQEWYQKEGALIGFAEYYNKVRGVRK